MGKIDRGYGPLDNHMYMYDLGWLVKTILEFQEELDTAIDLKTIHYADPIQWDITTQYSPNTVVVDPKTGTAYMSKVPVPAGIQLDNTDYWVVIFNYQRIYDKIMSGVAFNDRDNLEASKDISKYDFVWYGGDLYQAQRDIPQGSKYVPKVNIVATTIADALATYYGRDRVAQVINDTLTASETQTIGAKNRIINVTGDQTVTAGDIAETSANRTIKTTADYHIDVDGNLSDHVDGVTTVNRGGAVTKAYGSSLDVGVTGTYTAAYSGAVTETYNGKRNVTAKDTTLTASGTVTASANQFNLTSMTMTFPVRFPDKNVDLYHIPMPLSGFPGTDSEKIESAFSSVPGVFLDRDITLDSLNYTVSDKSFYIDGRGHTINLSGIVKSGVTYGNNLFFSNCVFDGTGGGYFDLLNNGKLLYQLTFTNCIFKNFNHDIFVGDEAQSIRFIGCFFFTNLSWLINVKRCDQLIFEACNIESAENAGKGAIRVYNNTVSLHILNTVIESQGGTALELTQLNECSFRGMYLESNTKNFVIYKSGSSGSTFSDIHCIAVKGANSALVELNPGNDAAMTAPFQFINCLVYQGNVVYITDDNTSALLTFTGCLYSLSEIKYQTPKAGIVSSDTLKYAPLSVSKTGERIVLDIVTEKYYGHKIVAAVVNQVYQSDNYTPITDGKNYIVTVQDDNQHITLYGNASTEYHFDLTILYC